MGVVLHVRFYQNDVDYHQTQHHAITQTIKTHTRRRTCDIRSPNSEVSDGGQKVTVVAIIIGRWPEFSWYKLTVVHYLIKYARVLGRTTDCVAYLRRAKIRFSQVAVLWSSRSTTESCRLGTNSDLSFGNIHSPSLVLVAHPD